MSNEFWIEMYRAGRDGCMRAARSLRSMNCASRHVVYEIDAARALNRKLVSALRAVRS